MVMSPRSYCLLTAILFALIALVQVSRPLLDWSVILNGYEIPMWLNWLAFFAFGILSVLGFYSAERA